MIFVGIDWSETHHDACILDVDGRVVAKGRVPEGVDGLAKLHEMVATEDPSQVVVGIELDRGLGRCTCRSGVRLSMPSTRSRWTGTETATGPRGRSRIRATPGCWQTPFEPIGICVGEWPGTPISPKR